MAVHTIHPENYQQQLEQKKQAVTELFADLNMPEPEVFESPTQHYRMRAEFKIWHTGDTCYYAMQPPGEKNAEPILMQRFEVASETIDNTMPVLLDLLNQNPTFKYRLFQVEFLSTLTQELLITLIYHRPLNEQWQLEAQKIQEQLRESTKAFVRQVDFIGRSRKQKWVLNRDYVEEQLTVLGKNYYYQQVENSFTQPNAKVCEKMITWACQQAENIHGDLLELYCGNGNFTIPLSHCFKRVLATEISKTSVASAQINIEKNQCQNIQVARLSSEEFTQAYNKVREFRRLADINLDEYQFNTVFVDPPRAGLDPETTQLVARFSNILYISCNPETLKRDIQALSHSHIPVGFAIFDQFPYTPHAECGAVLKQRG